MLIDIIGDSYNGRATFTTEQSRSMLNFCYDAGVRLFVVNFLYAKNENSEVLCKQFYQRLFPFLVGKLMLEEIEGRGFAFQECWKLNYSSIDVILRETRGDLLSNNTLKFPEDWVFYRGDSIFFQIVSHEQEAILRLTDAEYESFKDLGIPHGQGRLQWTSLPGMPIRAT